MTETDSEAAYEADGRDGDPGEKRGTTVTPSG